MRPKRWLAAVLVLTACFQPQREFDCLDAGTCECKARVDCAPGLDCVDGRCALLPDAGVGEQGWPCGTDTDCRLGPCLPPGPGNGRVCSAACDADAGFACEKGWQCKANLLAGGFACVPPLEALCLPCGKDADCNALGDRCLVLGGVGACSQDCSTRGCPRGYGCRSLSLDAGVVARQCIPDTGTCRCSAATAGLQRSCRTTTGLGTCFGVETCLADGTWAGCDARDASVEVCDGVDNDCNGLTDQADPNLVTAGVPGYPDCRKGLTCTGKWSCGPLPDGGVAFQCSAPDPGVEQCNGVDDNCNGLVDEGLVDSTGAYVTARACGSCATDCFQALTNLARDGGVVLPGAATCELRGGQRTCVPRRCAPGFYASPPAAPQICERAVSSQCRPCTVTDDCQVPGDQCVTVGNDPGAFCAQSCDPGTPTLGCQGQLGSQDCCPEGSVCTFTLGQRLCVPRSGTCLCDASRAGFSRSCFVVGQVATCVGRQTCGDGGTFGVCDTSLTTLELCDGRDNDCNGVVDDPFINTRDSGTYDTDQHCGACTTDCTARWSPAIQHAVGGCVLDGGGPGCAIVACTTGSVPGGGACRVDADCGPGRTCQPGTFQCVKACGAGCASGERCVGGLCAPTCSSDGQCQAALGSPSRCGDAGTCEVTYQYVNADREDTNGCECAAAQGVVDEPDVSSTYPAPGLPAVDRNCDHVDGVAATALYVWARSPSSQGTRTAPFRTIAEGLAAFRPGVHSAVLVAQGTYVEQVVLRSGVSLHGGYAPDFGRRDVVLFPTLIEAPEPAATAPRGTVNAENLTARTVVAGFTIRGYDVISAPLAGEPGRSSYAVYVRNAGPLELWNCHLVGGQGGDAPPAGAGAAGLSGGAGRDGLPSRECLTQHCTGESQDGGVAGLNPGCGGPVGGNAGAQSSGDFSSRQPYTRNGVGNGLGGNNGTYFHGPQSPEYATLCKYDCQIANGGNMVGGAALNGVDGVAGAVGPGCAAPVGSVVGGQWLGLSGGVGGPGTPGRGGGGGGAGGSVDNTNDPGCDAGHLLGDLGATGGGGGAGGCGGGLGPGAPAGGSSFGVFVVGPAPRVEGNLFDLGFGGQGGAGGAGGYGGLGGPGGRGGQNNSVAWCAGPGGPGGRGGNGGAGSGGGGGCGGGAFGVALQGAVPPVYGAANTVAPVPLNAAGLGGAGGPSPAGPAFAGGAGAQGVVAPFQSFP